MRIIRTDLKTGDKTLVAGYEAINLQTGIAFLETFAHKEADERNDVKHLAKDVKKNGPIRLNVITLVGKDHAESLVQFSLECPLPATYTSVFDDHITCTSKCNYYEYNKEVTDIETAENSDDADNADCLTDQYVTIHDNTKLREADGVTFDY